MKAELEQECKNWVMARDSLKQYDGDEKRSYISLEKGLDKEQRAPVGCRDRRCESPRTWCRAPRRPASSWSVEPVPMNDPIAFHQLASHTSWTWRDQRSTYICVPAESEADPSVLLSPSTLGDGLDVGLLLEHLGVLGHVLGRAERIEVTNVRLVVEHRHERCSLLTKTLEGDFAVEFKALDLLNSGYSVFRRGDKAVHSSHQSVSDLGLQRASAGSYLYLLDDRLPSLIGQVEDQILGLVIYRPSKHLWPVLQVDPSLIRRASREWREALQYYASHQRQDQTSFRLLPTQRNSKRIHPSDQ